jgi:predicted transposase YbfD/YdcC
LQANVVDNRDIRGRRHNLHFVICGVLLAILSGKVLISEIHRWLVRHHDWLSETLEFESSRAISDVQLRRLLTVIEYDKLYFFHCRYFGWQLNLLNLQDWISIDGKDLRGTIDGVMGQKRGLAMVHMYCQRSKISLDCDFYKGDKESEIIFVRDLLNKDTFYQKNVSIDALHCHPKTLEMVQNKQGVYVVGVKANQQKLMEDLMDHISISQPKERICSHQKAHGRIEKRSAEVFDVKGLCLEDKWQGSNIEKLIVIERHVTKIKTNKISQETAYYISNSTTHTHTQLLEAIRNHWQIESCHWVRDVTFGEDKIRCSSENRSKNLSCLLSVALNLTRQLNVNNIKELHENLNAKPQLLIPMLVHFNPV